MHFVLKHSLLHIGSISGGIHMKQISHAMSQPHMHVIAVSNAVPGCFLYLQPIDFAYQAIAIWPRARPARMLRSNTPNVITVRLFLQQLCLHDAPAVPFVPSLLHNMAAAVKQS
jgi:hypothetical protein